MGQEEELGELWEFVNKIRIESVLVKVAKNKNKNKKNDGKLRRDDLRELMKVIYTVWAGFKKISKEW